MRIAKINRETTETKIEVEFNLDGKGVANVSTSIPFLDHMLNLFAKHGLFDLTVRAKGDLEVDIHHTNEDVGIALREALTKALGDKKGIARVGHAFVPMGKTLSRVIIDIGGRPNLEFGISETPKDIVSETEYSLQDAETFFDAFTAKGEIDCHIDLLRAEKEDTHHALESIFKSFARALDMATQIDPRVQGIPSTKGTL